MLGVDEHRHNADVLRDAKAAMQGIQQEMFPEALALLAPLDAFGQAAAAFSQLRVRASR